MGKQVSTVLGLVPPENLGITDAHNHLWISRLDVQEQDLPVLDQQELILAELTSYRQLGGGGQIDCQPGGAGRDGNTLFHLASDSGVQIVACTGFHLKKYYPEGSTLWLLDADQAADYFLGEIRAGLEETREYTPVFPGFIKIAVQERLENSPRHLMEAACIASRESGLSIEMHTEKGAGVEDFVNYFSAQGLPAASVVICHIDKRPDLGLHKELAQAGFLLEYDTFFRPKYDPEQNLWPLIFKMVREGFGECIALATDLADSQQWSSLGNGPGLEGFITIIKKRLEDQIQDPGIVEKLMGGNISNRLAI
jgi:phosphotriesterase-related protein